MERENENKEGDIVKQDLEHYLDYLKFQKNYSLYTVENYQQDILEFFSYLEREGLHYKKLVYSDLRFFLMYLKEEKKDKNSSIDRKLSSLRGFYQFLANEGVVSSNVFRLLSGPKKEKKLPRYFEYNELEALFEACDLSSPLGQRNRLILEMLYATGVRVGELVSIKVSDINQGSRTILILGKGNKERIVPYGEYCEEILNLYLKEGYLSLNTISYSSMSYALEKNPVRIVSAFARALSRSPFATASFSAFSCIDFRASLFSSIVICLKILSSS